MSVNQLEATLQAVTHTLAKLEKEGCNDEKLLNELRKERDRIFMNSGPSYNSRVYVFFMSKSLNANPLKQ